MQISAGVIIDGKFKLGESLGSGGMGAVYVAEQLELDRKVALKILSTQFLIDDDAYARFIRESHIVSKMRHKNIVSIYAFGGSGDDAYIAMELLHGESLQKLLKTNKPLSVERSLKITEQICAALSHAHPAGVVHRDTPLNQVLKVSGGSNRTMSSSMRAIK